MSSENIGMICNCGTELNIVGAKAVRCSNCGRWWTITRTPTSTTIVNKESEIDEWLRKLINPIRRFLIWLKREWNEYLGIL
jgi:hypothetical protein